MLRPNTFPALLLCAGLLLSEVAFAVDPNGVWYGPSATRITVVATPDQVFVTINNAQGQIGPLSGKWNSIGERFSFQHNHWTYTAAIRSQAQIDVFNPNGSTSVWKRGRMQAANANMKSAAQSVDIARLWHATAGTSVQLDSQGRQVSVTPIDSARKSRKRSVFDVRHRSQRAATERRAVGRRSTRRPCAASSCWASPARKPSDCRSSIELRAA